MLWDRLRHGRAIFKLSVLGDWIIKILNCDQFSYAMLFSKFIKNIASSVSTKYATKMWFVQNILGEL